MSTATLQAVEDAIRAHFMDTLDEQSAVERRGAVIIDWMAAYTISNIVEVEGQQRVGYHNEVIIPESNPNSQANLAHWAADEINSILIEGDDD